MARGKTFRAPDFLPAPASLNLQKPHLKSIIEIARKLEEDN